MTGLVAVPARPLPQGEPAQIEVLFGTDQTNPTPQGRLGAGAAHGGGPSPGLRFAAPDPTIIPATDDPANRPPPYPEAAWASGAQGTVTLRLTIDATGAVVRLEKLASSGYASLDAAAERALRRWHFRPARQDGRPVASERIQPVRFANE